MEKKVSVIIPCFNQGKYVEEAINSVLNQTYSNIEIVCINDFSTDNSAKIIKTIIKNHKNIIYLENKENLGVIYSRNLAITNCSGEYILPLDADDTIEPTYIEKAVKILDENKDIGIVYCKMRIFGLTNQIPKLKPFDKSDILYENSIFNSALFRKKDFIKVGMYKDYMKFGSEDYDLWLSFIEQGFSVYQIDEILFNYRKYNEPSRTDLSLKNCETVWLSLIRNHIDLYLNDKQFLNRLIFGNGQKYKKYKKLFNKTLFISIIITIIQIIIIAGLICFR